MNNLKEINIKSLTYYFFDGMTNIKNLDLNKIKIVKSSLHWIREGQRL